MDPMLLAMLGQNAQQMLMQGAATAPAAGGGGFLAGQLYPALQGFAQNPYIMQMLLGQGQQQPMPPMAIGQAQAPPFPGFMPQQMPSLFPVSLSRGPGLLG